MREYIRHPSDMPIEYWPIEPGKHESAPMRNISEGGLCFETLCPLDRHALIHIRVPVVMPAFEADGIVVWCRHVSAHYEVGVCFHGPDEKYTLRMIEQVCHIEQYRRDTLKNEGRQLSSDEAAREWIEKFAGAFPKGPLG